MTAWQRLIARSSLALGTAWQHLTNQITGGGVVVNTGAVALLADRAATVTVADKSAGIALASRPLVIAVADTRMGIALAPGITVTVTKSQIQI